ncbi:MAG: hemerythrin family protein [Sulfurimonadaceae bacterium]
MIKQSDIPLVSVGAMNDVHFEEAAMVNSLLEQLESEAGFEAISASLEKLLAHMQEHFAGEEKLMQEAQYPSFRMHKGDHDKVLNEARYAEMEWRNRKDADALREYLEDDVVSWLEQHIKAMDTPMADFVSQFDKYKSY